MSSKSENIHLDFDYSVWTPGTEVILCSVPWTSAYKDIVKFDDRASRDAYFTSKTADHYTIHLENVVYLKYGEPILINAPFYAANKCNYIVVRNKKQPIPSPNQINSEDVFFYFINDVRYIAPNTTALMVQLDVWQSYAFSSSLTFGRCYIERGHIGIADDILTKPFNPAGESVSYSDWLIEPEGLSVGDEYDTYLTYLNSFQTGGEPFICITSTADLTKDFGTVENPKLTTATGQLNTGLLNGSVSYLMNASKFRQIMTVLSGHPWISQCITAITVIPRNILAGVELQITTIFTGQYATEVYLLPPNKSISTLREVDIEPHYFFPNNYSHLKKLWTYPYIGYELTDMNGSAIFIKPQNLASPFRLTFDLLSTFSPPTYTTALIPRYYNYSPSTGTTPNGDASNQIFTCSNSPASTVYYNAGDWLDRALFFTNYPQLSLVNNSGVLALANTANSRRYLEQTADWSYQKALRSASLSYAQETRDIQNSFKNMGLANWQTRTQNAIANEQLAWDNYVSTYKAAKTGIPSLLSYDFAGAVGSLIDTQFSAADKELRTGWNNTATNTAISANRQSTYNDAALAKYSRDTNYEYAKFASRGDYANSIAAIQASVADAQLIPPTVTGQTGGDVWNYSNGFFGFAVKVKIMKPNYIEQVGDYFLRYGYTVNRWANEITDVQLMERFTYWKMGECVIYGFMPEVHKEAIRGIFESGVTVWKNPNDILYGGLTNNLPVKKGGIISNGE